MSEYTLHLGDCLEYMRTLPDGAFDAVVTDPPYGRNHKTGWSKLLFGDVSDTWGDASITGDDDTRLRDSVLSRLTGYSMAVFGSWKCPRPVGVRALLIWDKGPASGMGDLSFPWKPSFEEIYIYGNHWSGFRDEGVLKGHYVPPRISMGRKHPNEKPVSLLAHIIGKLPQDFTIFDPFMGSGTTGVACMQLGRNFVGCEIDPEYFAIAEKRISEAAKQPPLFVADAPKDTPVQKGLLDA